jgi:hypothetical protein
MHKFFLLCIFSASSLCAVCSQVPEAIRKSYASNFYQAFVVQSHGHSTRAFCQFQVAYEEAKKAGENILKLIALEQLFGWYRMYGSASGLFSKKPQGHDRIMGEYQKPHSPFSNQTYQSEWGNTPEQAALIREFMLGVAETISGVFCIAVGGIVTGPLGVVLCVDGSRRIVVVLSNIWADHERAMLDLKKWEETAQKAVTQ